MALNLTGNHQIILENGFHLDQIVGQLQKISKAYLYTINGKTVHYCNNLNDVPLNKGILESITRSENPNRYYIRDSLSGILYCFFSNDIYKIISKLEVKDIAPCNHSFKRMMPKDCEILRMPRIDVMADDIEVFFKN